MIKAKKIIGDLGSFSGMKVISNPAIPETEKTPVRQHIKKPWMSETYHRRIQKKWLKRFGTKTIMPFYFLGPGIITGNPKNIEALKVKVSAP